MEYKKLICQYIKKPLLELQVSASAYIHVKTIGPTNLQNRLSFDVGMGGV